MEEGGGQWWVGRLENATLCMHVWVLKFSVEYKGSYDCYFGCFSFGVAGREVREVGDDTEKDIILGVMSCVVLA